MGVLVRSSARLNGPYLSGIGKERQTLDEVIGDSGRRALLQKLTGVHLAIETAKETVSDSPLAALQAALSAGQAAMRGQELDVFQIAAISSSELDPMTLLGADLETLEESAQILLAARGIARTYHEFSLLENTERSHPLPSGLLS